MQRDSNKKGMAKSMDLVKLCDTAALKAEVDKRYGDAAAADDIALPNPGTFKVGGNSEVLRAIAGFRRETNEKLELIAQRLDKAGL